MRQRPSRKIACRSPRSSPPFVRTDPGPAPCARCCAIAGRPLIEHQARRAARGGAQDLLVVVEHLPPELTDVLDRLRADGIVARVALGAADAAGSCRRARPRCSSPMACCPGRPRSIASSTRRSPPCWSFLMPLRPRGVGADRRCHALGRRRVVRRRGAGRDGGDAGRLGSGADPAAHPRRHRRPTGGGAGGGRPHREAGAWAGGGRGAAARQRPGGGRAVLGWLMDRPVEALWLRVSAARGWRSGVRCRWGSARSGWGYWRWSRPGRWIGWAGSSVRSGWRYRAAARAGGG